VESRFERITLSESRTSPIGDPGNGKATLSVSSFRRLHCWVTKLLVALALVAVGLLIVRRFPVLSQRALVHSWASFQEKSAVSQMSNYQCLDSYELSDFSSKGNMELAGWSFNWDDEFSFKPPIYQIYAPSTAYWGCSKHGGGTISLTLQGQGHLTLDFGNSWGNETSSVTAFLNGVSKAVAGPYTFSKTVKIPFKDGDTLDIVEGPSGVIVINSITFRCATTTTTSTTKPPPTSTTTATTITSTSTVTARAKELHAKTSLASASTSTRRSTSTSVLTTTTSAWRDIEKAKQKWQHEYAVLQKKRLEERKKKEQLEHQLHLEQAVLERIRKERSQLKRATAADEEALELARRERAEEERKRQELLRAERLGGADKDGHKSGESKEAKEAKEVKGKEGEEGGLVRSKKISQRQEGEKRLAEAVAKQKRHTQQELQELKTARVKEQEEEEEMAENMQHELEKVGESDGNQDHVETKRQADLKAPSLYCYSLMLPFGYEPVLLKAQKDKGVGVFACNEFAIFSNSSILLDTDEPSPVPVSLLDFSLAVPYGGKWHTALNTDVFNKVWTKIVSLKHYRMHDWVVKADPDSVLFPERLVQLLQVQRPLNQVISMVSTRRLFVESATGRRLQWHAPKNASCGTCMMPGFQGQSCNSHVQYIQKQGHSCSEALRRVARAPPTDCGCDCNRIESCDFQMDPNLYRDHRVIKGKAYPGAVYINNCKFGLHGPIEVLSQRAVTAYVEGLPRCRHLLVHPWGEDKFMDRCMLELGVTRVNQFGLLSEIACGETPAPCGDANVAFHPFKSISSYFACWEYADRYGHGPADPRFCNASSGCLV